MSKQLRELQARKATLVKDARALTDIAAAQARDMNDEEVAAFEALKAKIEATSAAIDREAALIYEEAQMNHPGQLATASVITVVDNAAFDPKHGFKSVGDFLKTVRQAQNPGAAIDERLLIGSGRNAVAPATFGSEGSGQDGGFLVPPQFAQEIFQLSLGEDSLLPLTDNVEITGNTMAFPKDETTPWGTNGIRAYWQGEAASAVGTKPVLGLATLRLKKLMALVPVTDELLDDTNALSTYLPDKIAASIRWKTNESILFGSGTGVPVGCMSNATTVTVTKESGQTTQTLLPQNLAKMISRLPPGSFGKAVWIVNNDVLPALFTLTLGNYPIYLPMGLNVGGIQASPYGTLLGRPVFVSQHANTFSAAVRSVMTVQSITSEIQKLAPSSVIELFVLDLALFGQGPVRFHAGTNALQQRVVWQGNAFEAFPIEVEGFEFNGNGQIPRPRLRVANVTGAITALVLTYQDLVGAKITRKRTLAKYLDAVNFEGGVNPSADPSAEFADDVYYVDRKSRETRDVVEFELAASFDLEGVSLPRRQIVQNVCPWRYRGSECGYTGAVYFDANDQWVDSSSLDVCGKRLSSCKARFGQNAELPFGGFPAAGLFR